MNYVGRDLKYNDNKVWHEGNFNPNAIKTILIEDTQTMNLGIDTNRVPIGLKFNKTLSLSEWQTMCILAAAKEYQHVDNALVIFKNGEIIEQGIEYKVSADKQWIEKINGNWSAGDVLQYIVYRSDAY